MAAMVEVHGEVRALTVKAVLLRAVDEYEKWFPFKVCRVQSGTLRRGNRVVLLAPVWLLDDATDSQPAPTGSSQEAPSIPPDMLRRLIQLCHPDRHDNSKSSTLATEWLLSLKARE